MPLYVYEEIEGKTVLVVDFRNLGGPELVGAFREIAEHIKGTPENSLLMLTLAQGIEYSQASMKAALELAKSNGPHTRKSAMVGLEHLTGLVNVINRLAGRSIRAFHERKAALEWLLRDD